MKQIAKLNYLRVAPRKVRLVTDLVKGLSVNDAEAQLMLLRKRPAPAVLKLLRSAIANAKNNQKLDSEKLYIEKLEVDQGPMLKRFLPRAKGMATPIQKKMSHITMVLSENVNPKAPRFKIVVPKKVKLPPGEARRPRKEKKVEVARETQKPKRPGFFKRLFTRRKAV
ncbi:MAG: 50S ribosomal protein L22 [Patescibacteria group bacterium]